MEEAGWVVAVTAPTVHGVLQPATQQLKHSCFPAGPVPTPVLPTAAGFE